MIDHAKVEAELHAFLCTIHECMDDNGITVAQAAEWADITKEEMEHGLQTGEIGIDRFTPIYSHTGDRRAYGIPKDWKPNGTLDEAMKLLARPDADKILAQVH
ncbi:hypothetical protein [Brevibacterium sediminis]